jgi:RNA polymerase sigma-70 factor (ECF subfamily)
MTQGSDHDLIDAILAGEPGAFEVLLARFQDRVLRLIGRFTRDPGEVEDIGQEVFVKVFRKLHTFQRDAGLYTWIYRVAVNTAHDHLGRRGRRRLRLLEDHGDVGKARLTDPAGSPGERLLDTELRDVTRQLVDELPVNYRTVLILREYEGLAYTEMAEVLGISIGTVESRLFRARQRVRKALEERFPELVPGSRHEGRKLDPAAGDDDATEPPPTRSRGGRQSRGGQG